MHIRFFCLLLLMSGLALDVHAAPKVQCEFAGQTFSLGATVCECPSLKGDGGFATGGQARIVSRRLTCNKAGEWVAKESVCLDLAYERTAGVAMGDFDKYTKLYCPGIKPDAADETDGSFASLSRLQRLSR